MQLRTKVSIPSVGLADLDSSLCFWGSCFADSVRSALAEVGLNTSSSPYGTIYNPIAMAQNIEDLLSDLAASQDFVRQEQIIINSDERHASYDFHSDSFATKEELISELNLRCQTSQNRMINSDYLILTFGTAWVYELKSNHRVVNNCHKMDSRLFSRRMLSVEEIVEKWQNTLEVIKQQAEFKKIIFTLSPIRHLRDQPTENTYSKAVLALAIKQLVESRNECLYFPSYEILLDELRDYRFFTRDMTHPSDVAIEYITKKFCDWFFTISDLRALEELQALKKRRLHRHRRSESEQAKNFDTETQKLCANFLKKYPNLKFV